MITHTASEGAAFRSRAIVGSATLAMVASSTARLMPVRTVAAAQYRRGVGSPSGGELREPHRAADASSPITIS
ncbi:Uncharacterised protein [Bordetella pertussis]|nr:Uncharacterised protein [Bordetella pertussis]CFT95505.1 Uncharacterised protein [Bordetella pertussis]